MMEDFYFSLISVCCGLGLFYLLYKFLSITYGGFSGLIEVLTTHVQPKKNDGVNILEAEFRYYQKLSPKAQKEFVNRVNYFYKSKNFIPKGGAVIEERLKVLISASAAQLTFGLPQLRLPYFKEIIIYPSSYLNKKTGKQEDGQIIPEGRIRFSLEHIEKSLDDPFDGYNLLLHELSKALRLEDYYVNEERHFLEKEELKTLELLFNQMKDPLKNRSIEFLNEEASENLEEFFSVSVESFFERPVDFKRELPDLYKCLVNLLKQDPTTLEQTEG